LRVSCVGTGWRQARFPPQWEPRDPSSPRNRLARPAPTPFATPGGPHYDARVSVSRRRRGFERAGCLPADQLGLPRAHGKKLVLAAAWRRVAGAAIARHARAIGIRRGVLEIAFDDERWLEALKAAIPRVAARLARDCPELGVRRLRLRREGREFPDRPTPLPIEADEREVPPADTPAADSRLEQEAALTTGDQAARLASAMERYLRRTPRR
jgi:hypothetical protein